MKKIKLNVPLNLVSTMLSSFSCMILNVSNSQIVKIRKISELVTRQNICLLINELNIISYEYIYNKSIKA